MASIPLQIQTPQQPSLLSNIGQLLQTRDLASQVQERQQRAAEFQAQAEQRNRDLADQNTFQEALKDPVISAKVHAGDLSPLESKIQPHNLFAYQKMADDNLAAHATRTVQEQTLRRGALSEVNNALDGLSTLGGIDKINAALPSTIANLESSGVLKNAGIDSSKLPTTISDPQQLRVFQATIGGALAAHDKDLANREATGKADKAAAEALITQDQQKNMQGGLLPKEQVDAKQAEAALAETQSRDRESARHNRIDEATAGGNLSLRNKEFEQNYGAPGDGSTVEQLSKALVEGRISFDSVKRMKGGQAALTQALTEDPSLTQNRADGMKRFLNGKGAETVSNLNMLAGHLEEFTKKSAEQGLRINPISADATQVATVANDVSSVMGKLVKSGALTQHEHDEYMNRLNSPFQYRRDAAISEMKSLIGEKLNAVKQDYSNATGRDMPQTMLGKAADLQSVPSVSTKAEFDALPSGAVYLEDGKKYKKP